MHKNFLALVSLMVCLSPARAHPDEKVGPYDVTPFLGALRPGTDPGWLEDHLGHPPGESTLYEIELRLPEEGSTSFDGRATVRLRLPPRVRIEELVFRLFVNADNIVKSRGGPPVKVKGVRLEGACLEGWEMVDPSLLEIKLCRSPRPGAWVAATMDFAGSVRRLKKSQVSLSGQVMEQLKGLMGGGDIGSDFGILARGGGITFMAAFYPYLAPWRSKAGWDKSPLKTLADIPALQPANYRITVVAEQGVGVAASGLASGRQVEQGKERHSFVAGQVRDVVVLAGKRLERHEASCGLAGVDVEVWLNGRRKSHVDKVSRWTCKALELFDRIYYRYPYRSLRVVEAPHVGGAGGMEFPGLVTMASMLFPSRPVGLSGLLDTLLTSGEAGLMMDYTLEHVVAHEVAHQWWNSLVGSDPMKAPFVDEALAQHSSIRYFEESYGPKLAGLMDELQVKMNYRLMRLLDYDDLPAIFPFERYGDLVQYAGVVYGKAPVFFAEAEKLLGRKRWEALLKSYAGRYAFGTAGPRSLLELASRKERKRLDPLYRRWILETHGDEDLGVPGMAALMVRVLELQEQLKEAGEKRR